MSNRSSQAHSVSHLQQNAGKVTIDAFTGGHPIQITVTYDQWNGERTDFRMNPEHLHDLRYCIDRMLAKIEEATRR